MMYLRRILAEDLPIMFFWRNDPNIYRWCRQNDVLHWANHEKWFEWQSKDPSTSMYMIEDGDTNRVGVCGLTSIDRTNRTAEFSLYIASEHHSKGYGKEALADLVNKGFKALNLNSIWGETFDGNHAAEVFEKVGFKKEGTRRQFYYREGQYTDCHLYSILREEWNQRSNS